MFLVRNSTNTSIGLTLSVEQKQALAASNIDPARLGDAEALKSKLQYRKQLAIKYFVYQQSKQSKGSTSVWAGAGNPGA